MLVHLAFQYMYRVSHIPSPLTIILQNYIEFPIPSVLHVLEYFKSPKKQ